MTAKASDLMRIQEMYDIASQTLSQLSAISFTRERFISPSNPNDALVAEGLTNRVFRLAEEGGKLSGELRPYGFDSSGMAGMRNILAHAYGEIDQSLVWITLTSDFPAIVKACEAFCDDQGIDLHVSTRNCS